MPARPGTRPDRPRQVGDVDGCAGRATARPATDPGASGGCAELAERRRVGAAPCDGDRCEPVAVAARKTRRVGARRAARALSAIVSSTGWRSVGELDDDPQDLGGRRLLLQRLGQLAVARLAAPRTGGRSRWRSRPGRRTSPAARSGCSVNGRDLGPADRDHADRRALAQQRHGEDRAEARCAARARAGRELRAPACSVVRRGRSRRSSDRAAGDRCRGSSGRTSSPTRPIGDRRRDGAATHEADLALDAEDDARRAPRTGARRSRRSASSTGWRSVGELEMTRRISPVAVCCSSASVSSRLRACSSANSRAFSIAITAWSAKVSSKVDLPVGERRWPRSARTAIAPIGIAIAQHRHGDDGCGTSTASAPRPARTRESASTSGVVHDGGARASPGLRRVPRVRRSGNARRVASTALADARGRPRLELARRRRGRPARSGLRQSRAGALRDRVEHRLEVGRRARDDAQDLAGGGLLLQRLGEVAVARLQLLEQPDVLDGDDRLVRERLQQRDLLVGERPSASPGVQDDGSDGRAARAGSGRRGRSRSPAPSTARRS